MHILLLNSITHHNIVKLKLLTPICLLIIVNYVTVNTQLRFRCARHPVAHRKIAIRFRDNATVSLTRLLQTMRRNRKNTRCIQNMMFSRIPPGLIDFLRRTLLKVHRIVITENKRPLFQIVVDKRL